MILIYTINLVNIITTIMAVKRLKEGLNLVN